MEVESPPQYPLGEDSLVLYTTNLIFFPHYFYPWNCKQKGQWWNKSVCFNLWSGKITDCCSRSSGRILQMVSALAHLLIQRKGTFCQKPEFGTVIRLCWSLTHPVETEWVKENITLLMSQRCCLVLTSCGIGATATYLSLTIMWNDGPGHGWGVNPSDHPEHAQPAQMLSPLLSSQHLRKVWEYYWYCSTDPKNRVGCN